MNKFRVGLCKRFGILKKSKGHSSKLVTVDTRIFEFISILVLAVRYAVTSIHTFGDCIGLVAVLFLHSQKQMP